MKHDYNCDISIGAPGFCTCIRVLAAPCKVCGKTHEMPECEETDIVKRLRSADWRPAARSTMDDAADEIVALRERVKIRDERIHDLEMAPLNLPDCVRSKLACELAGSALNLEDGLCRPWSRDENGRCNWCDHKNGHSDECEYVAFIAAVERYRKANP